MRLISIDTILWSGPHGGAVFNGTTEDLARHRFVASPDVMPRPPVVGETWLINGVIRKHPRFGPQVEVDKAVLQRPSGRLLISTIAKSRKFPGIGQVRAERLWSEFGEDLYDLLDKGDDAPFVELIGPDPARLLVSGWKELNVETEVYAWLDRHGVHVGLARKLILIYGDAVIEKLEDNPYRLLAFTSWKQADALGRSMGIDAHDNRRLVAASDAAVYHRLQRAHTWAARYDFLNAIKRILGCHQKTAKNTLQQAVIEQSVVEVAGGLQGLGPASMERYIAARVRELLSGTYEAAQMTIRQKPDELYLSSFFESYRKKHRLNLNKEQQEAVHLSLSEPLCLICGGAGVGKTTVLHAIYEAAEPLGAQLYMMALSGRAARRMSEATGYPATTIASFLKAVDENKIDLKCEPTLAIDEASMVDLATMYRILRRMRPGCKLLLIGDPGQLPPISFGVVFHALFETGYVPRIELTEIHRQAAETGIPQASQAVREGKVPDLHEYAGKCPGVSFIDCRKQQISDTVLDVVYEIGGFENAQVISPVKSGPAGTRSINLICHGMLAPGRPRFKDFALDEPVIWLVNNYDLGLMNGSLGRVTGVEETLTVNWDEGEIIIEDIQDMDLAYAITVHKAQGSQFPRVVVPVFGSRLLDRTLIYTAITRAQHQVVLIGDRRAFQKAVIEPPSTSLRQTAMRYYMNQNRKP
jgi:exodeoxyribonuclease V alpha subunit